MADWLDEPVTAEDWLNELEAKTVSVVVDQAKMAVKVREVPADVGQRVVLHDAAWSRLSPKQKIFLSTWRECGYNARKAMRVLSSTEYKVTHSTVANWQGEDDYAFVRAVLMQTASANVLEPEKLILRQDDIVEQLLEPTPVLHQGVATGFFEDRAPAAAKANEVLMRAVGILKGDEQRTRVTVRVVNLAGLDEVDASVVAEQ